MKDGYFHCFNRYQQALIRVEGRTSVRPYIRISNRSYTDWQPSMKGQHELKRMSMTEAEARAVVTLTGHKCFLEEKFV